MPSLRGELHSMRRMTDLDNSIRDVQHSFREKTPLSYESKLQNLFDRGVIKKKRLTRFIGAPQGNDWNDGNQFFYTKARGTRKKNKKQRHKRKRHTKRHSRKMKRHKTKRRNK